jgi:hypothetical protein
MARNFDQLLERVLRTATIAPVTSSSPEAPVTSAAG